MVRPPFFLTRSVREGSAGVGRVGWLLEGKTNAVWQRLPESQFLCSTAADQGRKLSLFAFATVFVLTRAAGAVVSHVLYTSR